MEAIYSHQLLETISIQTLHWLTKGNAVFAKHLVSVVITKQTVCIAMRRLMLN